MTFYLSDPGMLDRALDITGLSLDELEILLGYFRSNSKRSGLMRGKFIKTGNHIELRHHFTNKLIWSNETFLE